MALSLYREIIDVIWNKKYSTYENMASIPMLVIKKYGIPIT